MATRNYESSETAGGVFIHVAETQILYKISDGRIISTSLS